MPQVACPRCGTAQDAGASGYTCADCGAAWAFATCDHCGASFHMRPGTTEWTCPDCGTEHGGSTMGRLEPDDVEPPLSGERAPEEPAAEATSGATGATTAVARATPPPRQGGPPTRARLAAIAVIGIVVVLVVAFALSSLGGGGGVASPSPSLDVREQLCLHLRDVQTLREDALARLADTLQGDASAIQAQGDGTLAAKVLKVRTAVLAYRAALVSQGDLTQVSVKMGNALKTMPC